MRRLTILIKPNFGRADGEGELVSSRDAARADVPDTLDAQIVVDASWPSKRLKMERPNMKIRSARLARGCRHILFGGLA